MQEWGKRLELSCTTELAANRSSAGRLSLLLLPCPILGLRRFYVLIDRPFTFADRMPASTRAASFVMVLFLCVSGCAMTGASNHRDWASDQTLMPTAEFNGDQVTIRNVRNCSYASADDYELRYYNKTIDLGDVQSVDFIQIPFADMPQVAHVMMSFGTRADDYTCVSIEIRREKGEKYSPLSGFMNEYELMYIVGDERDLVQLRAIHRLDDVYVYRTRATPDQARLLLVDMLERANKLGASRNTITR